MQVSTETIDALFAEWNTDHTPGCVLAVIQDGAITYQRAYGMADLERSVPLSTDSIFDLGSIGKQFVATLIALFAEAGQLNLDDQVRQYIPELPDYGAPLTIRHLIHHTGGVRDYLSLMDFTNRPFENQYDQAELLDLIVRQQGLNFAPGEEFLYSNGGYFLLGIIAERIGQAPLVDLLKTHIFAPLGMHTTQGNENLRRIAKNRAVGYTSDKDGAFATDLSFLGGYGDGPVLSNVGDLLLWDQNFYQNRLGKADPELLKLLQTPATLNSGEQITYAFGLGITSYRGVPAVSHSGGWAGYVTYMVRFPEQRLSVICLSNLNTFSPDELSLRVADLYLEAAGIGPVAEAAKLTPSYGPLPVPIEALVGFYRSRKAGIVAKLSLHEGGLNLEIYGRTFPLEVGESAHLPADSHLPVAVVVHSAELIDLHVREDSEPYDRLAITPITPEELQAYAGRYYSAELDFRYTISVVDGQIWVKRGYAAPQPLKLVTRDLFTSNRQTVQFRRNATGEITSFELDAGRVKNISFARERD